MADSHITSRGGRVAVGVLSGGVLAMIWGAVWYEAVHTGRATAATWTATASQAIFGVGVLAVVGAIGYLKARRLSLLDGTRLRPAEPLDASPRTNVPERVAA